VEAWRRIVDVVVGLIKMEILEKYNSVFGRKIYFSGPLEDKAK
jgi:hypothetical protein